MSRIARPLIVLLSVLLLARHAAAADDKTTFDRWYTLLLEGQRAGWAHISTTEKDGQISTDSDMLMSVKRGPVAITMNIKSRFLETSDGRPVEATMQQSIGAMQSMKQTMRFTPESIEVVSEQGGHAQTQKHPLPEVVWLTPAAASRYAEAEYAKGAREIRFHTLDPSLGPRAIETVFTVQGEENIDVMGKTIPAVLLHATVSAVPGVVVKQYVDAKLQPVKMTVALMPGMEMTMLESDELLAKATLDPPEMLVQTLVKPDKPIANPRELRRAVYRLSSDGDMPQIPDVGYQKGTMAEKSHAVEVTVDLDRPLERAGPGDQPTEAHRQASPVLNSDDPAVRQWTVEALKGVGAEASATEKAEAIRAFVHDFVESKDLSVGFATASEVARTRQGDCTEHAVLLAAMLRAADIPSRTVTGLIYVDEFIGHQGVFGYHMWAQAWLPSGKWVDLDATLPDQAFDASHIALATSPMADSALLNDLVKMMPLLGQLQIEVIEP